MIAGGQHLEYVLLQALELASNPFSQKEVGTGAAAKPFQSISGKDTHTW